MRMWGFWITWLLLLLSAIVLAPMLGLKAPATMPLVVLSAALVLAFLGALKIEPCELPASLLSFASRLLALYQKYRDGQGPR